MKNKRTFLASIALGIFLMAAIAPAIAADDQDQGIKKSHIRTTGRAQ